MEKITYKLLKQLYRVDRLDAEQIKKIVSCEGDVSADPHVIYLRKAKFVDVIVEGGKIDRNTMDSGTQFWCISIEGRDYIENRRREFCMFWIPYLITTIIAAAALAAQILPLLVSNETV